MKKNKIITLHNYTIVDLRSYIYITILAVVVLYFVFTAYLSERNTIICLVIFIIIHITIALLKTQKAWIVENKIIYGNPVLKNFKSIEIDKTYLTTFYYSSNAGLGKRLIIRDKINEKEIIEVSEKKYRTVIEYLIDNYGLKLIQKNRLHE